MNVRLALSIALLTTACGRSLLFEPPPPVPAPAVCAITVAPGAIDFGQVPLHAAVTSRLVVANVGTADCQLSGISLDGSDPDFELPASQPTASTIPPGSDVSLSVDFDATSSTPPTSHQGYLVFDSNDAANPSVAVPLAADIVTVCELSVTPTALDWGHVAIGTSPALSTTLTNTGSATCSVSALGIAAGSDPEFSITAGQQTPLTLEVGSSAPVSVTFAATDRGAPHQKQGTLVLKTNDPRNFSTSVPLTATVDIGCDLTFAPAQLDFGSLILNTSDTQAVTLSNDGSATCDVTGVALGSGTDPLFTLPAQPLAFPVGPGGSGSISVTFSASDSKPPHQRSGTLVFQTGNPVAPSASVPLTAIINTACSDASQFIYTVDGDNAMFSRFDPATLTFTDIATLACPDGTSPFDMAVDQNAVAWVEYSDGALFQVDTSTAACQPTAFAGQTQGYINFGMGFVFSPATGLDTLYISGGTSQLPAAQPLATVAFPSLAVTTLGTVSIGFADLTGTGDGELWGFAPPSDSVTGTPVLAQLDTASGATLSSFTLSTLQGAFNADWAMKFWGGSFWIFIGNAVYAVDRSSGVVTQELAGNGNRDIVGAGVSTCAPVQ